MLVFRVLKKVVRVLKKSAKYLKKRNGLSGRIVEQVHGTRERVRDGSRESHVTEAWAGGSRERAPGPAGKANARRGGGSITGAGRRGGIGAKDMGRGMGEETSGNEGFRKNEVLETRGSSACACDCPRGKIFAGAILSS